jgi:uncharacterized protein
MKIAVSDISDEGLILDFQEKFTLEDIFLFAPVQAHLEMSKVGDEVTVRGGLRADAGLQCSRCLKEIRRMMEIPVEVVYHPEKELDSERHELRDDEMDTGFYKGEEIDLRDLLKEQLLLNRQMKPLCDENCRGICPVCGIDFNTDECKCEKKQIDPRLEKLKDFFNERKE